MKMLVSVVGLAALATACAQQDLPSRRVDREITPRDTHENVIEQRELFTGNGFISALGGRLDGAIGNVDGLNGEGEYVNFYDDGFYTSADVTVRGSNGRGMGILWMNGSVGELQAGDSVEGCSDDWEDNPNGPSVGFTGCSGPDDGGWDYDAPADCTDLEIDEPSPESPEGTVATVQVLAHWRESAYGQERTVKATFHLTEN